MVKLGDVCSYSKGKKPPQLNPVKTSVFRLPYINIRAFEKGIIEEFTDGDKCNLCEDGDLLMVWDGARAGYTGKAIQGAIGSTLMKIEPKGNLDKSYLFYFLQSIYKKINSNPRGVGIPHVEPSLLWNSNLTLPPLHIQQAIVSKIEELFSELDKSVEQLKTAQLQLKTYRQAVLKWAFEGRLTNEKVKEGELPKGWEVMELGSMIRNIEAGKSFKCDERPPNLNEYGIVKVSAVTWGEFDEMESKTVTDHSKINPAYIINQDDFLISRANTIELVGNAVIVKKISKKLMLSDKILRIKFLKDVNPIYVLYFLRTRNGRNQIETFSSGNQASMRNIGQSGIKKISIPMSCLSEQHQIVAEIESRLSVADKLEESISTSLQQAEFLRQSILKQAFEGKLI